MIARLAAEVMPVARQPEVFAQSLEPEEAQRVVKIAKRGVPRLTRG